MKKYYKILADDLTHHGYTYHEGLNVDPHPWDPEESKPGGFYFIDIEHLPDFYYYGTKICDIEVPENAKFIGYGDKCKADRVIIKNIRDMYSIDTLKELICNGLNIHACADEVFRRACTYGHLDTAKWIYSLGGVDIHAFDDVAFRLSCANKYTEITKWLLTIDDHDNFIYQ